MMSSETINPMMVKMKPTRIIYALQNLSPETAAAATISILAAVVPDRFDRTTFHRLFAKTFFFGRLGLFVDERVTAVVVALEIRGRSFAAQIAVDALLIDVEFAGRVLRIFVGDVSHNFLIGEREVRWKPAGCNSKAERFARVASKLETAQRQRKRCPERSRRVDIFRQGKDLEASAEHFRMEQRLQSALRFLFGNNFRMFLDDSGEEMMLVGESRHAQAVLLRHFREVGPIDVCGGVGLADLLEGRIERAMLRANLNHFAEFLPPKAVINRNHKSAFQLCRYIRDPVELRLVYFLFLH